MDILKKILLALFIAIAFISSVFFLANFFPTSFETRYGGYLCTNEKGWGFVETKTNCYILKPIK